MHTRGGGRSARRPESVLPIVALCWLAAGGGAAQACIGDCDSDGLVTVNELVQGVKIARERQPLVACRSLDADASGGVGVEELIGAVRHSLEGCPQTTPTPTPGPTEVPFVGFDANDVRLLAADGLDGRDNDSEGSRVAQAIIVDVLRAVSVGLNASAPGDDAFKQPIPLGTNILGVLRGSELPDEYIMIGAHYDHFAGCSGVCNGATDNATGTAVVLAVARQLAHLPPPRRSIIFALWDREEDGLLGSAHFVANPLVPLVQIKTYVNFDIQGATILPSLRRFTFAVAGESGGPRLLELVGEAARGEDLDVRALTAIFGQSRSDYANFLAAGIPTVFFSDSTGPCYHTSGDDPSIVNFEKLAIQSKIAFKLTAALAATDDLPQPTALPGIVFSDAVAVNDLVNAAVAGDLGLLLPADQAFVLEFQALINRVVAEGPARFDNSDVLLLIGRVSELIDIITNRVPCNAFLPGVEPISALSDAPWSASPRDIENAETRRH